MAVGLWKLVKGKPDRGTRLLLHLLAGIKPTAQVPEPRFVGRESTRHMPG